MNKLTFLTLGLTDYESRVRTRVYQQTYNIGVQLRTKGVMLTVDEIIHILNNSRKYLPKNASSEVSFFYNNNSYIEFRNKNSKLLKLWEKYWNKRIEKDPYIYSIIVNSNLNTPYLDKKWKHLAAEFGLFD